MKMGEMAPFQKGIEKIKENGKKRKNRENRREKGTFFQKKKPNRSRLLHPARENYQVIGAGFGTAPRKENSIPHESEDC